MKRESHELLKKMKACEFVFDMKLGQVLNKNAGEDKEYVRRILDLLYEHFDRVRYVDDLSASVTGKNGWSVMISEKFAMMDKRVPIPQVPFHIKVDGKNKMTMNPKESYELLERFLQESDDQINVFLNFRQNHLREAYVNYVERKKVSK